MKVPINLFPLERMETYISRFKRSYDDEADFFIAHRMPAKKVEMKFLRDSRSSPCYNCDLNYANYSNLPSKSHRVKKVRIGNVAALKLDSYNYFNNNDASPLTAIELDPVIIDETLKLNNLVIPALQLFENHLKEDLSLHLMNLTDALFLMEKILFMLKEEIKANPYLQTDEVNKYMKVVTKDRTLLRRLVKKARSDRDRLPTVYCDTEQYVKGHCLKEYQQDQYNIQDKEIPEHYFVSSFRRKTTEKYYIMTSNKDGSPIEVPCNNVYGTGAICFGSVVIRNDREAYNNFWESVFNDDLTNGGYPVDNLLYFLPDSWLDSETSNREMRNQVRQDELIDEIVCPPNVIGHCMQLDTLVYADKEQNIFYLELEGKRVIVELESNNSQYFIHISKQQVEAAL